MRLDDILTQIFTSNVQKEANRMDKNELQKVYEQVGMTPALTKGMQMGIVGNCSVHGLYPVQATNVQHTCPLCVPDGSQGNGTTATDVKHWIDIKDKVQEETGYRPHG